MSRKLSNVLLNLVFKITGWVENAQLTNDVRNWSFLLNVFCIVQFCCSVLCVKLISRFSLFLKFQKSNVTTFYCPILYINQKKKERIACKSRNKKKFKYWTSWYFLTCQQKTLVWYHCFAFDKFHKLIGGDNPFIFVISRVVFFSHV